MHSYNYLWKLQTRWRNIRTSQSGLPGGLYCNFIPQAQDESTFWFILAHECVPMTRKIQLSVGVLLRFYYVGKKSTSWILLLPETRLISCGLKSNHSIGLPKMVQSFEIAIGLTWITSWLEIQMWSQESPDISKTLQLLKAFRSHGIFSREPETKVRQLFYSTISSFTEVSTNT